MDKKQLVTKAYDYAKEEIEKYGMPTKEHFELSYQKAIWLGNKFNVDIDISKIGVCLMDLKLGQAFKEGTLPNHIKMSADASRMLIDKATISKEDKEKIINCIEAHHGTVEYKWMEAEICANADCYRFIHPKGVFAAVVSFGKRFDNLQDVLKNTKLKMDEKKSIVSLDIVKEELEPYYKQFSQLFEEVMKE